jgi:ferredoxin
MTAIDVIKRRLKEDRVPDVPDEMGEKKKRPREVAFMDVNLCFPCGKCPEFCPVQCSSISRLIPYLEGACSRYRIAFRSASAVTSA